MNVKQFLAWRYIRSKNSHSVIRWISGLSILVTIVVSFAMVVVLSAFNGIQGLVNSFYDTFEPTYDVYAEPSELNGIPALLPQGVKSEKVVEAEGLLQYEGRQTWVVFKGVSKDYLKSTGLVHALTEEPLMNKLSGSWVVPGLGVKYNLGLPHSVQLFSSVSATMYSGKKSVMNPGASLVKKPVNVGSYFSVGPEFDLKYVLCPLAFLTESNPKLEEFAHLEVWDTTGVIRGKEDLVQLLPGGTKVEDVKDRHGFVFKTHRTEKRMTFLILFMVLFISLFNAVASVVMLVLDKKREVQILGHLGMEVKAIRRVFYNQSLLMGIIGVCTGLLLGVLFVSAQSAFGIIPFEGGVVPNYPVELMFQDLLIILVTVITTIGLFSAIPVRYIIRN